MERPGKPAEVGIWRLTTHIETAYKRPIETGDTDMTSIERQIDGNHNRRMANESRFIDRRERLEAKIERECLIGELNSGKFYFFPAGGKYFEATSWTAVADHIIKLGYVR
jgi:hypothetical protein